MLNWANRKLREEFGISVTLKQVIGESLALIILMLGVYFLGAVL